MSHAPVTRPLRRGGLAVVVVLASALGAGPGAADAATVVIAGGDATDSADCTSAQARCSAEATGGAAVLRDVDIHYRSAPNMQINGGAADVLAVSGGSATASAVCVNDAGVRLRARTSAMCRVWAVGGRVSFHRVVILLHRRNGTTTANAKTFLSVQARPAREDGRCRAPSGTTRTCSAEADGGKVGMRGVDLVDRTTGVKRTNVDIVVDGGDASASVRCAISATGTPAPPLANCFARAQGGDVELRNVYLHTYEV